MSMSAKGRMGAVVALLLLAAAFLLWPARDARLPDDTPEDTPEDTTDASPHVPGPGLVGQDASGGAQSNASEPDGAVAEDTPDASWKLNFTVEGAPGWQRASFVPVDKGSAMGTGAGDTVSRTGSLRVSGSGRLVIHAEQRVPWISGELRRPSSGEMHVTASMEPGLAVSGTVVAADGVTPLVDGSVRVRQEVPSHGIPNNRFIHARGDVDKLGRFHITGLQPGKIRVSAIPANDESGFRTDVNAQAGDELSIRMHAQGIVNLTIVDAETRMAPDVRSVRLLYRQADGSEAVATDRMVPVHHNKGVPVATQLKRVWCGKPFTVGVRAYGYVPFDIEAQVPAHGGSQDLHVALTKDPNGVTALLVRLRFADGDVPERITVGRHTKDSATESPQRIENGELRIPLDPEVVQVVIGAVHFRRGPWAATRIPIRKSDWGRTLIRDVTMVKGGHLQFERRPPGHLVSLEHDGEHSAQVAFLSGDTVAALYPGLWKYRIEGHDEIWTGEALIRSGETTLATPTIEHK